MLTDGRTNGWKTGSLYHTMPEACVTTKLWWGIQSRHLVYLRTNSLDLNGFIHHSILLYYIVKDIFSGYI